MRFDEHFLQGALSRVSLLGNTFPQEALFGVDSRTLKKGEIFVALEGEQFEGHNAIEDALKKGVSGVF